MDVSYTAESEECCRAECSKVTASHESIGVLEPMERDDYQNG